MTVSNAFKPLSRDDVAAVLGVSTRTLENWVNDGTLPSPAKIGNRVYWHPNIFYAWLDRRLAGDTSAEDAQPSARLAPLPKAERAKSRSQPATAKNELDKIRSRSQAQLEALMA